MANLFNSNDSKCKFVRQKARFYHLGSCLRMLNQIIHLYGWRNHSLLIDTCFAPLLTHTLYDDDVYGEGNNDHDEDRDCDDEEREMECTLLRGEFWPQSWAAPRFYPSTYFSLPLLPFSLLPPYLHCAILHFCHFHRYLGVYSFRQCSSSQCPFLEWIELAWSDLCPLAPHRVIGSPKVVNRVLKI